MNIVGVRKLAYAMSMGSGVPFGYN